MTTTDLTPAAPARLRDLSDDDLKRAWLEGIELVHLALTERDFMFDGEFFPVRRPTSIATRPLPGATDLRSPACTLPAMVELARKSSTRIPRTKTPSTRPLAEAIKGCSMSGSAEVTPGVLRAFSAMSCQLDRRPSKPCTTTWPFNPTILSNSSARKPFITLMTMINAATPSATAIRLMLATRKIKPSPLPGSK